MISKIKCDCRKRPGGCQTLSFPRASVPGCLSYAADNPCKPGRTMRSLSGQWQVGRGAGVDITRCSQPDPLELHRLLAHTCTPQTAYNPSRERPKSARHFNSRHASHGLETEKSQGNAKYFDNQGTKRLTLNTKRQEKHYRLVKMLP